MPGPRNTKKKSKKSQTNSKGNSGQATTQKKHSSKNKSDSKAIGGSSNAETTTRSASNSCPSTPPVVTPPPPHLQPSCISPSSSNHSKQSKPAYASPLITVASPDTAAASQHTSHTQLSAELHAHARALRNDQNRVLLGEEPDADRVELDLDVLLQELELALGADSDRDATGYGSGPIADVQFGGDEDLDVGGDEEEGLWQRKPSLEHCPPSSLSAAAVPQASTTRRVSSTNSLNAFHLPSPLPLFHPSPTLTRQPHLSDHLLLPLPIHDPGTGPRILQGHTPSFLNSYFAQPVSREDALCEEFGQEEVREMLCSVLPEELGLIVWYNKSRLSSRICPTCRRIYRLGDTLRDLTAPPLDPDNPEDPVPPTADGEGTGSGTNERLGKEQALSGLCSPICYILAAFDAPGAIRQTWGRSVDEIGDEDWAVLNAGASKGLSLVPPPHSSSQDSSSPDDPSCPLNPQKQNETQGNPHLSLIVRMTRLPDLGLAQMLFPGEEFGEELGEESGQQGLETGCADGGREPSTCEPPACEPPSRSPPAFLVPADRHEELDLDAVD
jgi:hypothetical protein